MTLFWPPVVMREIFFVSMLALFFSPQPWRLPPGLKIHTLFFLTLRGTYVYTVHTFKYTPSPGVTRCFASFNTPCLSSVARGNQATSWLPSVIQSCLSASPAASVMLLIVLFFYCPLTQSCFKGLGGFDGFSTAAVTFEDSSSSAVYLDVSVWEPCH